MVDKALQLILDKLAAPEGEFKVASDDDAHREQVPHESRIQ